jgi:hypothetical protein
MEKRSIRYITLLLAILIGISVCSIDTDAQRRRKRRARRAPRPVVTNPVIAPPGSEQGDSSEKIISTADENGNSVDTADEGTPAKKKVTKSGDANIQQTIEDLSHQVNRLNDRLSQMQENDRSLLDMERLTRAEQRAESVRAQMLDTESKLADLQARMDEVDYSLKPENIDRSIAGYGSVHPEEARDARRRQLEKEKARLQAQINLLENSRTRLQASLSTAETEVDLLRRRIDEKQLNNASRAQPAPTPDEP